MNVPSTSGYSTHEVLNQPGALHDINAYAEDRPLVEAVGVFGAAWASDHLHRTGALVGSANLQDLARRANRHLPELRTHDRFGHRADIVEFHPAYHELMRLIYGSSAHSFAWIHERPGAQVARGVLSYLWNQGENGVCCPMGMTFAAIPALRHDPALLAEWAPRINSIEYDPRAIHAAQKTGATVGMAMTEKQGGSDLRATLTTARPASARRGSGADYLITGHKWFFSVPMSDLFLTLAQTETGLSCFLATGRAEALLSRICTPVAKYWACKRAPAFVAEALECHGGNGFIADHLMERLYREAPLNGIWEGTGNVVCLDVLRSMQREPETVGVFLDEVRHARGGNARLDAYADDLARRLADPAGLEPVARRVVEMMAFALQASLLVRHSTPAAADAFCATRLDGDWGQAFGTLPRGLDTQAIVDRARVGRS